MQFILILADPGALYRGPSTHSERHSSSGLEPGYVQRYDHLLPRTALDSSTQWQGLPRIPGAAAPPHPSVEVMGHDEVR